MSAKIFLIRHGESEWNASHRYTGQQNSPLSPLGKRQAQRIAERLADEPLAAIYSSPLRRARDTALAIAKRKGLPVTFDDNLKEICHGLWEGLTGDQVEVKFAAEFLQWRTQPARTVMPQGESLDDLAKRVQSFQHVVAQQHDAAFAICSHDAVLRVLILCSLGLGLEHFWKFCFENASLSLLDSRDGMDGMYLVSLNDTAHLNGARSNYSQQAV